MDTFESTHLFEGHMASGYFLESDTTDTTVGFGVRVEDETIGTIGWVGDGLMRVDLLTPVSYLLLVESGLELNKIVFSAKA
jgi:hypothetical protein